MGDTLGKEVENLNFKTDKVRELTYLGVIIKEKETNGIELLKEAKNIECSITRSKDVLKNEGNNLDL